jgi:hypothetical protein
LFYDPVGDVSTSRNSMMSRDFWAPRSRRVGSVEWAVGVGCSGPQSSRETLHVTTQPCANPTPPKHRLLAHAPHCSLCKRLMKVRTLLPGRRFDDVSYRCEDCGEEVMRPVPRAG